VIRWLDAVVPPPADKPPAPPIETQEAMQRVTRQTAFEPDTWTPERAAKVGAMFDALASEWNERQAGISRYEPLHDALARGAPGTGRCLEVGSGTGLATPALRQQFDELVSLDLSHEMLVRGVGARVEADAGRLPMTASCFDSAVLVNALLFPAELDRVLAPGASLVWVNTRGDETPIHLPPEDVARAMRGWHGVAAYAGMGLWAVLRRSDT
jgi:SAM-dependent methyltransferase